jgi:hypothetical protein
VPIRPASMATMSAAIARVVDSPAPEQHVPAPTTLTFASGRSEVVTEGGCMKLPHGEGGIVALDTGADTRFVLFSGPQCKGSRIVASGEGPVRFASPVEAGTIVLG